jgi:hypothetical protein
MGDLMQRWTAAMREERYADAWALSEAALAARDTATRDDPRLPYHLRWVWDGRTFDGADVLIRCYQGLGDTIQFARFLPLLARRARRVTVEAQRSLLGLLGTLDADLDLVPFDPAQPLPAAECDIEITELPFALRAGPQDVPTPYLSARRAALPDGVVAICHEAGEWNRARCVPAALFRSICAGQRCLTLVPGPTDLPVLNPQGCPMDMDATAALVGSAALVITVDTMIAHLAGALGRPTWLLLKADPDWRWTPGREDTPWYPTMRLFAQPHASDWRTVLDGVERALADCFPATEKGTTDGKHGQPDGARFLG